MSRPSVTLFGTAQAELDGRPIKFPTHICLALLAYLVVNSGQPHRRESLAELLWPEQSEQAARTNLRQTLHRLRAAIGDIGHPKPHLLVTTQDIQLNPHSDHRIDVSEFKRCLAVFKAHCGNGLPLCANCHEALKTASSLYAGDFMAGFSLSASPSFELWLVSKQEEYRRQALQVLGRLGAFYEAIGEFSQAAEYARRLVAMEPWRESSHRLLMRSLAQAGQRQAALIQYNLCRQLLSEELGAEPSTKTRQLYERIRDQDGLGAWNGKQHRHARSQRAERSFVQDESSSPAPFVGRENELAKLDGHLA